jgi:hypothetical protein
VTRSELERVCAKQSCWESERFTDGPVTAELGPGWECLMADRHFSNKHRCVSRREGGFCDGIAIHRQSPARGVRLIEAKASGSVAQSRAQLRQGAELVVELGGAQCPMTAECHTEVVPRNTLGPQRPLRAAGRLIPIGVYVAGEKQQ